MARLTDADIGGEVGGTSGKRQTVSALDDAHERRRIAELASVPGAFDPRRAAILGWQPTARPAHLTSWWMSWALS